MGLARLKRDTPENVTRVCGARTRRGTRCTKLALPDSTRCHLHGGRAGRPRGTPEHPASRAARLEGRQRWVERMRAARAAGLIERFPNGRRAKGLPPRSKDRIIARGQRLIEQAIAMAKALPAVPNKSWEEMTDGEKFASNFSASLDFNHEVLNRHTNWEDTELLKLKKEIALSTQAAAIRVKVAELGPRSDDSVVERLMRRVAAIRRGEKVIGTIPATSLSNRTSVARVGWADTCALGSCVGPRPSSPLTADVVSAQNSEIPINLQYDR